MKDLKAFVDCSPDSLRFLICNELGWRLDDPELPDLISGKIEVKDKWAERKEE